MFRSVFLPLFRSALPAFFLPALLLVPALSACAAKELPVHTQQGGALPSSGRVVIRSGLAWMNEQSPLFGSVKASLTPLLQQRGLTVVEAAPSTLRPMPGPRDTGAAADTPELGAPARAHADAGDQASADAAAKQTPGKPLKLPPYTIPGSDAKLPPSVLAVEPVDPIEILFARSQADGMPLLRRGGRIPGRIPPEMLTVDPALADYTLVVRVTLVSPQGSYLSGSLDTRGMVAAAGGGIGGVPGMGYGSPAPASPPPSSYGGTPGDYGRGYEYGNPNDTWHRESDFRARDYMTKHGQPPQYASPPSVPGRGDTGAAGALPGVSPGLDADYDPIFLNNVPGGVTGFALEMECYDLRNLPASGRPTPIWTATVQRRADQAGLPAALPGMLQKALAK